MKYVCIERLCHQHLHTAYALYKLLFSFLQWNYPRKDLTLASTSLIDLHNYVFILS